MVLGSPKQRNLLPGVTHEQAVDYAVEVFERIIPAIGAAGVDLASSRWRPTIRTSSIRASKERNWSARSVTQISSCTWT